MQPTDKYGPSALGVMRINGYKGDGGDEMTKKSPRGRASEQANDPAHAPGKQHLELEREEHASGQVHPETESHRPVSDGRIGRGRTPRRG